MNRTEAGIPRRWTKPALAFAAAGLLALSVVPGFARNAPAFAPPPGDLPVCREMRPALGIDWSGWDGRDVGRPVSDLASIAGEFATGSTRVARDLAVARRIVDHLRAKGVADADLAVAEARIHLADGSEEGRKAARSVLEPAIAAGSRAAARLLGDLLAGSEQDAAIAAYRVAAAAGDPRAAEALARLLVKTPGTDPAEADLAVLNALTSLVGSMQAGDCRAARVLADIYADGVLVTPQPDLAFAWLLRAADLGDPGAALRIASAYRFGRGVQPDEARSIHYLEIAARSGRSSALIRVGTAYLTGEGVPHDPARAEDYLVRAADAGRTDAWRLLAQLWRGDFGDPAQPDKAFRALTHASEAPGADAEVWLELGRAERDGFGTAIDGAAALAHLERAAEGGSAEGARQAGEMLETGAAGIVRDVRRAVRLYRLAASGGSASAANRLATLYRCGSGIDRSLDLAATWAERAAFLGSSASMRIVSGGMLASSDPITRSEGFLLLRQAARRGHLDAIADMVIAYETGRGPDGADETVARRWEAYGRSQQDAVGAFDVALARARLSRGASDGFAAAERLLKDAIAAGNPEASYELARALDVADLAGPDELVRLLTAPASAGFVPAMRKIGEILGSDRTAGGRSGTDWIAAASEKGDFAARLAQSADLGPVERMTALRAIETAGLACDASDFARLASSWNRLGEAGRETAADYAELAARTVGGEDGSTLYTIADVMLNADRDPAEARRMLTLSMEAGEPKALKRLAEALAGGGFGAKDPDGARKLLIARGDGGDHDADVVFLRLAAGGTLSPDGGDIARVMDRIGGDLDTMSGDVLKIASRARDGVFGPEGVKRARSWLETAAEAGRVPAMRALADILLYGSAEERDPTRGLDWMRRAAEAGDREALKTLSAAYEVGFLVDVDRAKAAELLSLANGAAGPSQTDDQGRTEP